MPKLTGAGLPRPIEGIVPDYTAAPSGCRFHPRCEFAEAACREMPPVIELGSRHRVACVLPERDRVAVPN